MRRSHPRKSLRNWFSKLSSQEFWLGQLVSLKLTRKSLNLGCVRLILFRNKKIFRIKSSQEFQDALSTRYDRGKHPPPLRILVAIIPHTCFLFIIQVLNAQQYFTASSHYFGCRFENTPRREQEVKSLFQMIASIPRSRIHTSC